MTKKSALQKIEDHEKLCRIMQKQTFEQIKEIKERVTRMERMIRTGLAKPAFVRSLTFNIDGMKYKSGKIVMTINSGRNRS